MDSSFTSMLHGVEGLLMVPTKALYPSIRLYNSFQKKKKSFKIPEWEIVFKPLKMSPQSIC